MASRSPNRQPRLYVVSFNGTWAGGVLSSRKTVVSEFVRLLADDENVVELPINGVGSDISLVDRVLGGLSGWGTLRNIIIAMRNISKQYKPGDRIILLGYSRGAWAARYLAMLIDKLGLPKDADEEFFKDVYRAHNNGFAFQFDQNAPWLVKHERWSDVRISALCCFDTIRSLGMPLTGLARPLAFLKGASRHNNDIVSDVPANVDIALHCLSLHETRAPYHPTFMRGSNVHQVLFPGTHRDLGWIEGKEGLVHAPFAWMIQQLHTHLGLRFDQARLTARFPSYNPAPPAVAVPPAPSLALIQIHSPQLSSSSQADRIPNWCQGHLQTHSAALLAVVGKRSRSSGGRTAGCSSGRGGSSSASDLAGVQVHIGARLRAQVDDVDTVPGFALMAPIVGKPFWVRRQVSQSNWPWARASSSSSGALPMSSTSSSTSPETRENANASWRSATRSLEEAPVGLLEARLLGLPAEVVGK